MSLANFIFFTFIYKTVFCILVQISTLQKQSLDDNTRCHIHELEMNFSYLQDHLSHMERITKYQAVREQDMTCMYEKELETTKKLKLTNGTLLATAVRSSHKNKKLQAVEKKLTTLKQHHLSLNRKYKMLCSGYLEVVKRNTKLGEMLRESRDLIHKAQTQLFKANLGTVLITIL